MCAVHGALVRCKVVPIWILSFGLFVIWFVCKFLLGKGGFIHILLLCAISLAFVQWIAERRKRQG